MIFFVEVNDRVLNLKETFDERNNDITNLINLKN